ncbi:MAG TPA: flavodoxin domain-containing protein [Anaerolineaceae bacterium]|mgnify:CR=1 FL=1|nr:flavodoxin domain-containing protein [Anaerolineaceae bacterium]HQH84828.1 flavodoxin domain-containing protein [Anaerolineaceae bacterium]
MEKRIIVAYASIHGSTQEVAECIAETIREQGVIVDLQPASKVKTLEGYQGVILGSALYIGHMNKHALNFLSRFKNMISNGIPIAVFAGGPLKLEDDPQEIQGMLYQDLAKYPWLKPVSVELIGGRFDPSKGVKFPWNLLPAVKNMEASDIRDWNAIKKWAVNVSEQLLPA